MGKNREILNKYMYYQHQQHDLFKIEKKKISTIARNKEIFLAINRQVLILMTFL